MQLHKIITYSILLAITGYAFHAIGRNIHRTPDPGMPEIVTQWLEDNQTHLLRSYHLTEYPLFKEFDYPYIQEHLLPMGSIPYYYNPEETVEGTVLDALLNELCDTITQLKARNTFTVKNFKILTKRNFYSRDGSGALILKFEDYPFVVKLFRETPESFVHPFTKGIEQQAFFNMGGGVIRYLAGFTRIKNLEITKKLVSQHPEWRGKIDFPRKWYWLPRNNRWFKVNGKNIGNKKEQFIELPSIYAIVADLRDIQLFSSNNKKDAKLAMRISRSLNERLDPHIDNFGYDKKTGTIVCFDTEHFPTIVGASQSLNYTSYPTWYYTLMKKFISDSYLTTKQGYRLRQQAPPIAVENNQTITVLP